MPGSDNERITAFEHRFARAQATDIVELPWGYAVLQSNFPLSQSHNRIAVTSPATAGVILAATDDILGGAAATHRSVSVDSDELGQALSPDFEAAGYEHEIIATMAHSGHEIERAERQVRSVSLDTVRPAIRRDWHVMLPNASEAELDQLADRTALYTLGAALTRLAVFDGDEIAAHGDLYVDRADGIAQFENLVTHPDFRRRGCGDALVRDAIRRGQEAGCDLSCLTADLEGWPAGWYERLGYVEVGRTHHFSRQDN